MDVGRSGSAGEVVWIANPSVTIAVPPPASDRARIADT
jgi:hypothetical protein